MRFRLSRGARLIRFPATDGVDLEGRLTVAARDRGVVLCHPHPLYGGSMLTPVILTAEQAFQEAGYTTLAFNFRGVGGSRGTHDDGRAEGGDVAGALACLADSLGGSPRTQAVAGYSFGSVVGGRVAAEDWTVSLYLGIAPPLNRHAFGFLRTATCRIALIGGSRDEFCDRARLDDLHAALIAPVWLRVLDTDHFFTRAMDELAVACRDVIAWAAAQDMEGHGRPTS
ncbi:MAG: alpha/beta hydrolase [Candidatus Rokuibacteriota bacterium]